MKRDQEQKIYSFRLSKPAAIFTIVQIIFIILLVISIPKLFQSKKITDEDPSRIPVATISNFSSVVPDDYSGKPRLIEETLFQLILRNSLGKEISKSTNALIRENSIRTVFFEKQNLNYFSAIIDVPELEQSYWFYNEYSNDKPNKYIDYSKSYRIFCLDDSQEIIYPDFNCKDGFGFNGRYELVSDLISYFEFKDFTPIYRYESGFNKIKISPHSFEELAIDTKELYIQQVKDAIASLGISPDIFTYSVMPPEDVRYYYPLQ